MKLSTKTKAGIIIASIAALLCFVAVVVTIGRDKEKTPPEVSRPPVETQEGALPGVVSPEPTTYTGGFIDGPQWGQSGVVGGNPDPDYEDTSFVYDTTSKYHNERQLIYQYNDAGDTITLGLGADIAADCIYLNPKASITEGEGRKVGYYISLSSGLPVLSNSPWGSTASAENEGYSNFVIRRTYEELIPATYTDESNFGVAWRKDILDGAESGADITVFIRAIDLGFGDLLASLAATIKYDTATQGYMLSEVHGTDVRATGLYLTEADRETLIEDAYELLRNPIYSPNEEVRIAFQSGNKDDTLNRSIVEYLGNATYFSKLFDSEGKEINNSRFLKITKGNIVAVSLYVPTDFGARAGHITLYYSPGGLGVRSSPSRDPDNEFPPNEEPITSQRLVFAGYDYYAPFTGAYSNGFFSETD